MYSKSLIHCMDWSNEESPKCEIDLKSASYILRIGALNCHE